MSTAFYHQVIVFCPCFSRRLTDVPSSNPTPASPSSEVYSQLVDEIRSLMGALAYVHVGLEKSPYAPLTRDGLWIEICDLFTRDACALLGLSVDSPLLVV